MFDLVDLEERYTFIKLSYSDRLHFATLVATLTFKWFLFFFLTLEQLKARRDPRVFSFITSAASLQTVVLMVSRHAADGGSFSSLKGISSTPS